VGPPIFHGGFLYSMGSFLIFFVVETKALSLSLVIEHQKLLFSKSSKDVSL
jgi:hypothetical protein